MSDVGLPAGPELRALIEMAWDWPCEHCGGYTTHVTYTDDHGCEVGSGCLACRTMTKFYGCRYASRGAIQQQRRAS